MSDSDSDSTYEEPNFDEDSEYGGSDQESEYGGSNSEEEYGEDDQEEWHGSDAGSDAADEEYQSDSGSDFSNPDNYSDSDSDSDEDTASPSAASYSVIQLVPRSGVPQLSNQLSSLTLQAQTTIRSNPIHQPGFTQLQSNSTQLPLLGNSTIDPVSPQVHPLGNPSPTNLSISQLGTGIHQLPALTSSRVEQQATQSHQGSTGLVNLGSDLQSRQRSTGITQLGSGLQSWQGSTGITQLGSGPPLQQVSAGIYQLGSGLQTQQGPAGITQLGSGLRSQQVSAGITQLGSGLQSQQISTGIYQLGSGLQTQQVRAGTQLGSGLQSHQGSAGITQLGSGLQSHQGSAGITQLGSGLHSQQGSAGIAQLGGGLQSQQAATGVPQLQQGSSGIIQLGGVIPQLQPLSPGLRPQALLGGLQSGQNGRLVLGKQSSPLQGISPAGETVLGLGAMSTLPVVGTSEKTEGTAGQSVATMKVTSGVAPLTKEQVERNLAGIVVSGVNTLRDPILPEPEISLFLTKLDSESDSAFHARKTLSEKFRSAGYSVLSSVTAGHIAMNKAKLNVTYPEHVQQTIDYMLSTIN
jgi:hypothetical protein